MSHPSKGIMVVTGGSRGIGAAISLLAAGRGYDVCINYSTHGDRAQGIAAQIEEIGQKAMIFQADVSQEAEVADMFRAVDNKLGPVSALVNNAGISGGSARVDELDGHALDLMFHINIKGTFLCCKEALLRMSTRHGGKGGGIVNFSSAAARLGAAGRNVHYAASKAAINTLTFGLAQEVAAEGIRVNAISPGMITTEMQDPERLARMTPMLPMQRAGSPEEVAQAALWLLSDEASYVSGTVLGVSGAR
ncbi:SDR family oxidoreductase [Pusillimonas sp. SM2304]|uniref:SDR family oxidoreductase n=1 Tax=Pusillimonas sp. SM2304 TaxID=3073241 RepID=UPI002874A452|nr:SDR family oxidoreductase [Pusillimonas sp. SM2304]MDS1139881.1 SDR family oxidoreductase [Pusillimonas sp. SM2304]